MTAYIEGQKVILKPTSTNPYGAPIRKMGVSQLEAVVSWVISPERFRVDLGELAPQMGLRGDRTEITVLLDVTYPDWEVEAVAEAKPVYPPELSKAAEIAAEYIEFDNAEAAFAFAAENNTELKAELASGDAAQVKRNFVLGFEGHKAQSGGGGWSEMLAARKQRTKGDDAVAQAKKGEKTMKYPKFVEVEAVSWADRDKFLCYVFGTEWIEPLGRANLVRDRGEGRYEVQLSALYRPDGGVGEHQSGAMHPDYVVDGSCPPRYAVLAGSAKEAFATVEAWWDFYAGLFDEEADFCDEIASAVNAVDLNGASVEVMWGYISPETPEIECRITKGDAEAFFYRSNYRVGSAPKVLKYISQAISDGAAQHWHVADPSQYVAQRAADERVEESKYEVDAVPEDDPRYGLQNL